MGNKGNKLMALFDHIFLSFSNSNTLNKISNIKRLNTTDRFYTYLSVVYNFKVFSKYPVIIIRSLKKNKMLVTKAK